MSEYILSRIRPNDRRAVRQMDELLEKEGISRDRNLDYSVGLFDDDYRLVGTGSCFDNTLRCMAVSSDHQGEGLLNQILTHLIEYQFSKGNSHLFLYTKCSTAGFFSDLGFYEIGRVDGRLVFMENRKNGFSGYLAGLKAETAAQTANMSGSSPADAAPQADRRIGAVIMNANPFTLGHQYLLDQAAADTDLLHVFVVSEDVSLIPFSVRERLVHEGSAHLKNLVYHRTGPYMISNATFPSYFLKDSDTVIDAHARLDICIFLRIAKTLGISCRFVGEEPFSHVTGIYNRIMKTLLEENGLACHILPRKASADGSIISASDVRRILKEGTTDTLSGKVPAATLSYFLSPEAAPVLSAIREAKETAHY